MLPKVGIHLGTGIVFAIINAAVGAVLLLLVVGLCRRHRPALGVVLDVAVHPIDRSGEERAQEKRERHPILDNDIGWPRKEIEADVLFVERVVRAIGHVAPPAMTRGPRQPLAHEFHQVGQPRNARGYPLEVGGTLRP